MSACMSCVKRMKTKSFAFMLSSPWSLLSIGIVVPLEPDIGRLQWASSARELLGFGLAHARRAALALTTIALLGALATLVRGRCRGLVGRRKVTFDPRQEAEEEAGREPPEEGAEEES
mmetsp:Transcript_98676/g.205702  ORF Transcript_98676/g.205702 Transcript_98676/m.205702 type:complete len:118 (-) Transcript_98676:58-411(-)